MNPYLLAYFFAVEWRRRRIERATSAVIQSALLLAMAQQEMVDALKKATAAIESLAAAMTEIDRAEREEFDAIAAGIGDFPLNDE